MKTSIKKFLNENKHLIAQGDFFIVLENLYSEPIATKDAQEIVDMFYAADVDIYSIRERVIDYILTRSAEIFIEEYEAGDVGVMGTIKFINHYVRSLNHLGMSADELCKWIKYHIDEYGLEYISASTYSNILYIKPEGAETRF